MQNRVRGRPEHETQAMLPVRAENDEIGVLVFSHPSNFDSSRADNHVYCTGINATTFREI